MQLFQVSIYTGGSRAREKEVIDGINRRLAAANVRYQWCSSKDEPHETYAIRGLKMESNQVAHRELREDARVRYVTPVS